MRHKQVPFVKQVPPLTHWHGFVLLILFKINGTIKKVSVTADIVVFGVIVAPEIHGDGGKQIHWAELDVICCKHGHDVIVQFIVKQLSKFKKNNN